MVGRRKIILALIIALCTVIALIIGYYFYTSRLLTVSNYRLERDISSKIRIVHLSDLHNAEFGEKNKTLVNIISEQSPNIIVMTGDMINRDDSNLDIIKDLISDLSQIAPVYYGYGNHESEWEKNWNTDLHNHLEAAGAVVLNNEYIDTELNGQKVRIGGYMGYYRQPGMFDVDERQRALELNFADDFEDTDRFKILLNHIPTQWVDWDYINKYPVDVVFSGHYHGGLIRIPVIDRGIYAPYVGLFPEHTKGIYPGTQATCILSAGLGSEYMVPRLNNPPEVVVADLVPLSE